MRKTFIACLIICIAFTACSTKYVADGDSGNNSSSAPSSNISPIGNSSVISSQSASSVPTYSSRVSSSVSSKNTHALVVTASSSKGASSVSSITNYTLDITSDTDTFTVHFNQLKVDTDQNLVMLYFTMKNKDTKSEVSGMGPGIGMESGSYIVEDNGTKDMTQGYGSMNLDFKVTDASTLKSFMLTYIADGAQPVTVHFTVPTT